MTRQSRKLNKWRQITQLEARLVGTRWVKVRWHDVDTWREKWGQRVLWKAKKYADSTETVFVFGGPFWGWPFAFGTVLRMRTHYQMRFWPFPPFYLFINPWSLIVYAWVWPLFIVSSFSLLPLPSMQTDTHHNIIDLFIGALLSCTFPYKGDVGHCPLEDTSFCMIMTSGWWLSWEFGRTFLFPLFFFFGWMKFKNFTMNFKM